MTTEDTLGKIAAIWRYPVKSMMGEGLNACEVTARGLAGDRAYALYDPETGRIGTAKIQRQWGPLFRCRSRFDSEPDGDLPPPARITLPDGETVYTDGPDIDARLSELVGRDVQLISERPEKLLLESPELGVVPESDDDPTRDFPVINGFFDLGAVHLLTTATIDTLRAASPGTRFEARRFRPNLVVETPPDSDGFLENGWVGKTLAIGDEVRLKIFSPTIRCVVTTLPQDDLPRDPNVLRTAAENNQGNVGVYAVVEAPGRVRRGDPVHLA